MMLTLRLWLGASVSVMVLKVDVLLTTLRTGRISEPQSVKFSLLQVTNSPSLMKNIPLTSATNFLVSLSMLRCPSHTTRCLNGYRVRCERPSRLWGRSKKQCIIVRKWTLVLHRTWPSAWFFSRGGQIRESVERKSPACSKGWARARVCGEASNSWWRVLKIMHEYSVYWDFQRDYWLQLTKRMVTVWDLTVRGRSMISDYRSKVHIWFPVSDVLWLKVYLANCKSSTTFYFEPRSGDHLRISCQIYQLKVEALW